MELKCVRFIITRSRLLASSMYHTAPFRSRSCESSKVNVECSSLSCSCRSLCGGWWIDKRQEEATSVGVVVGGEKMQRAKAMISMMQGCTKITNLTDQTGVDHTTICANSEHCDRRERERANNKSG